MSCCCCARKKPTDTDLVEEASTSLNKLNTSQSTKDKGSCNSIEEDEEEVDPDALKTWQVMVAVVMLIVFAFCFATTFFLMAPALNSLGADFENVTYKCEMDGIDSTREVACYGYPNVTSPCIQVKVRCEGFNESKTLYEHYQSYFNEPQDSICWCDLCSALRCQESARARPDSLTGKLKIYPLPFIRKCCTVSSTDNSRSYPAGTPEAELYSNLSNHDVDMYYDRSKPEAVFFQKSESGTNNVLVSEPLAYVIIVMPISVIGLILIVLGTLFAGNKLAGKEIYRPVTPITPMHKKIKGKWYLKETNPQEQPKMNAFEKLQNIKRQQEISTSQNQKA